MKSSVNLFILTMIVLLTGSIVGCGLFNIGVRSKSPTYTVERSRDGKLDIGDEVIVQNIVDGNIRGLRIRTGPGLNSKILGRVHDNATGIVIDGSVNADNYTWWKVRWNPGNLDCEENPCVGWSAEFVNNAFILVEN